MITFLLISAYISTGFLSALFGVFIGAIECAEGFLLAWIGWPVFLLLVMSEMAIELVERARK